MLAATGGSVAVAATFVPAAAQPARLVFTKPVTAIPAPLGVAKANTGEPRLQLLPSGRLLLTAQFQQWNCTTRQPSSALAMCVWESDDDGRTFHVSGGDPEAADDADFTVAPGGAALQLAMSDPSVGPATLGSGIGGTNVFRSTDNGRTWSESRFANGTALNDRPFLVRTAHTALISYTAIPGNIQVIRSTDGGRSWSRPIQVTPIPSSQTIDGNGGPSYDATTHTLLLPYYYSTDPSCTSGAAGCFNVIALASSTDDGLTWTTQQVAQLPTGEGLTSMAQITTDSAGSRFLTFGAADGGGHYEVDIATAKRGGRWSAPRAINGQTNAMVPWAVTTGRGHIDIAYYRSTAYDAGNTSRAWDFVVSDSRDGGRTFTMTIVGPNAYVGTGAAHQSSVWDLEAITRDKRGRLVVAWSDDRGRAAGPTVIRVARSMR